MLAGCQHGGHDNGAVRQAVFDYYKKKGLNAAAMDVSVSSVNFQGDRADAAVVVTLKGKTDSPPMNFTYHLQQQNNQWVVTGTGAEQGGGHGTTDPNGGGAANPHGGGMPPADPGGANPHGGAGSMPSPQDLPPATKK